MDLFGGSAAIISECQRYRYRLERQAEGAGSTAVIMVNPSTADAEQDDATIRKLLGFGARHRWGRIVVGNLFAYRATDVRELGGVDDPIGRDNDRHLISISDECDRLIYAWGPMSKLPTGLRERYREVHGIFRQLSHLPMQIGHAAKDGHPKHPLMLPYDSEIVPWGYI